MKMAAPTERTPLLSRPSGPLPPDHDHSDPSTEPIPSDLALVLSKSELLLHPLHVGERLPYNNYATIDWLHDLVKDSARHRALLLGSSATAASTFPAELASSSTATHEPPRRRFVGLRRRAARAWDASQGWVAAALIGFFTALVAWAVDVAVAGVSGWKEGHCAAEGLPWWNRLLMDRDSCCARLPGTTEPGEMAGLLQGPVQVVGVAAACAEWRRWAPPTSPWTAYGIYVCAALAYGVVAGVITLATKKTLPAAAPEATGFEHDEEVAAKQAATGKTMYMAAGSGIPEIKTILSGFVIPGFLDFKVLAVKAVGSTFAVATGMCLGKEGPFVHISTCVGWLVARRFSKYRSNERKMREMLSVACSSGLSVAFGAPIGGVLFSYEVSLLCPRDVE